MLLLAIHLDPSTVLLGKNQTFGLCKYFWTGFELSEELVQNSLLLAFAKDRLRKQPNCNSPLKSFTLAVAQVSIASLWQLGSLVCLVSFLTHQKLGCNPPVGVNL